MSYEVNRVGAVGRKTKLTPELTEAYREIVQRYAYSFTYLSVRQMRIELEKKGYVLSNSTIHSHLKYLKRRCKTMKLKPLGRVTKACVWTAQHLEKAKCEVERYM